MAFVDQTVSANTDIASSYIAGTTVENRQLKVIKLKVPNTSTSKAVWIDCGIHAVIFLFDVLGCLKSSIFNNNQQKQLKARMGNTSHLCVHYRSG